MVRYLSSVQVTVILDTCQYSQSARVSPLKFERSSSSTNQNAIRFNSGPHRPPSTLPNSAGRNLNVNTSKTFPSNVPESVTSAIHTHSPHLLQSRAAFFDHPGRPFIPNRSPAAPSRPVWSYCLAAPLHTRHSMDPRRRVCSPFLCSACSALRRYRSFLYPARSDHSITGRLPLLVLVRPRVKDRRHVTRHRDLGIRVASGSDPVVVVRVMDRVSGLSPCLNIVIVRVSGLVSSHGI